MADPPGDSDCYRRRQRRRALIGWGGALAVIALIALGVAFGGEDEGRERVSVPSGEMMTAAEFEAIAEGEGEAEVLERLGKSGRPESRTEDYVLVLFPPATDEVECSYWEFSDEPQIFARLCFERSDGELAEKLARDVHEGFEEAEGTIA